MKLLARILRAIADSLDPPAPSRRKHPGLEAPAEIKPIPQVDGVASDPIALPRPTRVYLPGEWGGPFV